MYHYRYRWIYLLISLIFLSLSLFRRYRKTIKSIEEGVEMVPSIVPQLDEQIDRDIPLNTSNELILFCRRVYDFRLKRLIKNPS